MLGHSEGRLSDHTLAYMGSTTAAIANCLGRVGWGYLTDQFTFKFCVVYGAIRTHLHRWMDVCADGIGVDCVCVWAEHPLGGEMGGGALLRLALRTLLLCRRSGKQSANTDTHHTDEGRNSQSTSTHAPAPVIVYIVSGEWLQATLPCSLRCAETHTNAGQAESTHVRSQVVSSGVSLSVIIPLSLQATAHTFGAQHFGPNYGLIYTARVASSLLVASLLAYTYHPAGLAGVTFCIGMCSLLSIFLAAFFDPQPLRLRLDAFQSEVPISATERQVHHAPPWQTRHHHFRERKRGHQRQYAAR